MTAQTGGIRPGQEMTDAFGNTVKVKEGKKELSRKDQKAKHRLKQMRLKRGEEISSDDDY